MGNYTSVSEARDLFHGCKMCLAMSEDIPAIVDTERSSQAKYDLLAVPDAGLVGTIVAGHMIRSKKMREVGYVRSEVLPPIVVVHDGARARITLSIQHPHLAEWFHKKHLGRDS